MKGPDRLIDDPLAPPELSALLRQVPRAHPLNAGSRRRVQRRLLALSAVPVASAAWIAAKTAAAAFALAAGATAVGVSAVHGIGFLTAKDPPALPQRQARHVQMHGKAPASLEAAGSSRTPETARRPPPEVSAAPERGQPPSRALPSEAPRPVVGPLTGEATFDDASTPGGLAAESALLDRARRTLGSDPTGALALTDQHRQRFPRPYLAAERDLIRVDALLRLGRNDEARALADSLMARDQTNLYRERIRRLFDPAGTAP